MSSDKVLLDLKKAIEKEVIDSALSKAAELIDKMVEQRVEVSSAYLSVNKACEYLDVSRTTFYKLLETHKPAQYKLHNSPRYFIKDLDKLHVLVY